ncbi:MAG TPA: response regulator [Nitrospirae bacterium]|nr:C4-dicarboxylate transport transcriptional regulatory protein DctD [bacterium BMS3Abin10]GBE38505.1 C4-dicarboxylate transport transcriptional regulatory protein DctD [bacterium BMS3Bbin08]HDH01370.1 response regulator [Nitrospirota bacterium]HDH51177.1 response regulator [Nitrospirota bacterium]HDK82016.1 response regulator [Nitrospirota bacterium]
MVVDDEPIVGKRLKRLFKKEGYEVEAFTRSASAIMELDKKTFDIIITDLKMEGVDGLKLLKIARGKNPSVKVIIITGYGRKSIAKEAINKGAFDFITKPFKVNDLKQSVRKAERELRHK